MNEPIISPWLIYAVSRLDAIKASFLMLILLSSAVVIVCLLELLVSGISETIKRFLLKSACVLAISTLLVILIPSKEEAIAMYVASKVTPQVVQQTGETIDKITDKIVDKITKLKEAE